MALRFFHTADWHLGQTFHGYDRDHEHAAFLEWLLARLVERRPHALLLAGDVFDTVNPSAFSQRRLYGFLAAAHQALPELQVVLTAGNHDAAARLEAPAALFEAFRIRVIGVVPRHPDGKLDHDRFLVPLRGDSGEIEALALAVPFLRPSDVPALPDAHDPYLDGIRALYRDITRHAVALRDRLHPGAALVALGHCHLAAGRETQESERRLVIGGAEALRPDTFPETLAYVALGHLHLPQSFDKGRIRYSGSPIPLSFSESRYEHQILEVAVEACGVRAVTPHLIPRCVPLLRLPETAAAPLSDLLPLLAGLPAAADVPANAWPYVEINLLDDGPDPTRRRQIESALENKAARLAAIRLHAPARSVEMPEDGSSAAASATPRDAAALQSLDPVALTAEHYRQRHGQDIPPDLLACLREIVLVADTAGEPPSPPPSQVAAHSAISVHVPSAPDA